MRIKYPQAIQESEEELTRLEQSLRGQKAADRVRVLRLLKSATAKSLKDCAPLVGYSVIQLTRWWERYRAEGLTGLLKQQKPVGKASRLTSEAWAGLLQAMRAGHIATMQDARNYLEREWGISYKNGKSLWWLFEKHRVKWKTGRRRLYWLPGSSVQKTRRFGGQHSLQAGLSSTGIFYSKHERVTSPPEGGLST